MDKSQWFSQWADLTWTSSEDINSFIVLTVAWNIWNKSWVAAQGIVPCLLSSWLMGKRIHKDTVLLGQEAERRKKLDSCLQELWRKNQSSRSPVRDWMLNSLRAKLEEKQKKMYWNENLNGCRWQHDKSSATQCSSTLCPDETLTKAFPLSLAIGKTFSHLPTPYSPTDFCSNGPLLFSISTQMN